MHIVSVGSQDSVHSKENPLNNINQMNNSAQEVGVIERLKLCHAKKKPYMNKMQEHHIFFALR